MAFKFEDLRVWQKSLDLGKEIRELTNKFPSAEKYALKSQMVRAIDSVGLNIAEGSTAQSNAEFKRFLGIGLRSAIEVIACLHIAYKNEYIEKDDFDTFYSQTEQLIIQIQALRNSIK